MITTPNFVILANGEQVALETAERILNLVATAREEKRNFYLVLSGGSTPKRLYEILAEKTAQSHVSWNNVYFFWGDERCVAPNHIGSNYKMAYEAFLSKINLPASHIHRLQGEIDPESAALNYEKTIRNSFGLAPADHGIPSFDLVLLGMGADGHTASLFPSTSALKERTRWVVANNVPKLAEVRLTLTPVILNHATSIFFLVAGGDKAKTLKDVLYGTHHPDLLPSQFIRPDTGKVTWLIDTAASGCLENKP